MWWDQENCGIERRSIGLNIQRLFLKSKIAKLNTLFHQFHSWWNKPILIFNRMFQVNSHMAILFALMTEPKCLAELRIHQTNTRFIMFSLFGGHWLIVFHLSHIFISYFPECCSFHSYSSLGMWFAHSIKWDSEEDPREALGHSSLGRWFSSFHGGFRSRQASEACIRSPKKGIGAKRPSLGKMLLVPLIKKHVFNTFWGVSSDSLF